MRSRRILLGFITLLSMACVRKGGDAKLDTPGLAELPRVERIQLQDLDGNAIELNDYRGKRVFLNLWATWCRPCIAEMPAIDRAAKELLDENFVFLAASDENMDRIRRFANSNPFSFQYVQLKNSIYALDVIALPTTFIINAEGEIIYEKVGAHEWDRAEVLEELRRM